jgi:CheY-like chemotaxis protein
MPEGFIPPRSGITRAGDTSTTDPSATCIDRSDCLVFGIGGICRPSDSMTPHQPMYSYELTSADQRLHLAPTVTYYLRKVIRLNKDAFASIAATRKITGDWTADLSSLIRQLYPDAAQAIAAVQTLERLLKYHEVLSGQGSQHQAELDRTLQEITQLLGRPAEASRPPVLLIDDRLTSADIANLDPLVLALRQRGLAVESLPLAAATLASILAIAPDLIIIDTVRPEQGYEICRECQANSTSRSIPIVLVSSVHTVSDKVKALRVGAVDYIAKPAQMDEVVARVETQLKIRSTHNQLQQETHEARNTLEAMTESSFLLFQKLLNCPSDYLLFINEANQILYADRAASTILGYSTTELLQRTIHDIDRCIGTDGWDRAWEHICSHRLLTLDSVHQTAAGSTIGVELELIHVTIAGQNYCYVAVYRHSQQQRN